MSTTRLARTHGVFNVAGGLWPLLHMDSFEAVTGPKVDRWLVRTVSLLMVANGLVQLNASRSPNGVGEARRVGMATAVPLAAIDLVYASQGRISKVYLLDAVAELGWVAAWLRSRSATH